MRRNYIDCPLHFSQKIFFKDWDNIPEEAPDAIDLAMLDEIKNNPDCHEFVSEEEAMKLLGL